MGSRWYCLVFRSIEFDESGMADFVMHLTMLVECCGCSVHPAFRYMEGEVSIVSSHSDCHSGQYFLPPLVHFRQGACGVALFLVDPFE